MARADLLCDIIKFGINGDINNFRKAAAAICAEERAKQHKILADKIEEILKESSYRNISKESTTQSLIRGGLNEQMLFTEVVPKRRIEQLILDEHIVNMSKQLVDEQLRADILRSYGIEPRNKILLMGPPGNGKTSLAEGIADALMVPLLIVKYESIVGAYLGETAGRLSKLFDYAKARQCVLFFDEFETLGKERGDMHETGEIKRVVSSLLLQIDSLPSYVVVIAATNHEYLLDKAVWRRFQIKLELGRPTRASLEIFFAHFAEEKGFSFGLEPSTLAKKTLGINYAEAEELAMSIYRRYVLQLPSTNVKAITEDVFRLWDKQVKHTEQDC